ncbi:DUF2336 domain-containing protein [Bradyrhizobium sp. STM 3562]|uniref:DUF2336 domain-containing protein n=1 Tax=Bradyrhizobium sp. STM 3562 TaxID=578924 RepID=UPI00388E4320
MTRPPLFQGFDGLMTLSRREGVDIRPTLLRVLTDLYVQTSAHSSDEARQFVELTSRLIDEVDDGTRTAVRARLEAYPGTPPEVLRKLGVKSAHSDESISLVAQLPSSPDPAEGQMRSLSMQPKDAAELCEMFFHASGSERISILHSLAGTPLKAASRLPEAHAKRAIETLEMAAFAADLESFTLELGESLMLPARIASQIADDASGEPLATAMRALTMPGPVFQRVLLFLKPAFGSSVHWVFRLSRLYEHLNERSALIMLAAWRGATAASSRAKFRPSLYDDERQRARFAAPTTNPVAQPGSGRIVRTGTDDS